MQEPPLLTERLILRHAVPDDLAALHAILSNPAAMQYWSTLPHVELAETKIWLDHMLAETGKRENYIVALRDKPALAIGKAGCWNAGEVGVLFAPSAWGHGYAAEALRAILPREFARDPNLMQIMADVDPRNAASINLLKKLGFTVTGRADRTLKLGDVWCDSLYLALPRPVEPPAEE
jgi:RimJ/RimL family protein N-acetyltransferase